MTFLTSRSLRMNVFRGFHRCNKQICLLARPYNKQIFTLHHRACSLLSERPPLIFPSDSVKSAVSPKIQRISKAMKAYLERARLHEAFIHEKDAEFEIGKRHLANMMGVDAESFTQADINKAIEYLMPSGLYDKKARPMMKPPKEMYPKEKAAQFDASGRPFSSFFYTCNSNFYEAMHEISEKFTELDEFEDKMLRKGINGPPEETALNLRGSTWIDKHFADKLFLEYLTEASYNHFIDTLNRLCAHPYAYRCKDLIFKFRRFFVDLSELDSVPDIIQDENGRLYMTAESKRKSVTSKVTVWGNGEGKIKINDMDISFFYSIQDKEQVMFPLQFAGLLGKVDVEATVTGEKKAHSAQAGAIRHALSLCLRSFVPPEEVERMRLAGLLTKDVRRRERKKPGQKGARAKYTWVKR